jgi:hypothetical protein
LLSALENSPQHQKWKPKRVNILALLHGKPHPHERQEKQLGLKPKTWAEAKSCRAFITFCSHPPNTSKFLALRIFLTALSLEYSMYIESYHLSAPPFFKPLQKLRIVSLKVKKLKRLRTIAHKFFNGDKARRMIRDNPLQKLYRRITILLQPIQIREDTI